MNFIPTIIAIGFVALAPNKLTAQGYIYDQQSSANPASVAGGFVIQAGSPAGQSFTPNLSGIGFVQFAFVDANSGNGIGATVYVNLHSTGIGGPILATTSPVFMPDTFGQITSNYGENTFFFDSTVLLQSGTTYYLEVVVQSGDPWFIRGNEFAYSGGTTFQTGLAQPYDLYFREGIVPEPSVCTLVFLGATALWWLQRGRERKGTSPLTVP